jgi:hypothetical protein
MGKVTPDGLSGLIGPIVLYTVRGRQFVRSRPVKRSRKKAKKPDATQSLFGKVSSYGSAMTGYIKNEYLFAFTQASYNSVRGWMRDLLALHGEHLSFADAAASGSSCRLHPDSDLRDLFRLQPGLSSGATGTITAVLPAFNPLQVCKAPVNTEKVHIQLVAVSSAFSEKQDKVRVMASLTQSFAFKDHLVSLDPFTLKLKGSKGDLAMVVLSVSYECQGRTITDPEWLPAAAIGLGRI